MANVVTARNNGEALISRRTWRIIIIVFAAFVIVMIALWIIRFAKKSLGSTGGGKNTGVNADGTPTYIPASVDQSYIERIAGMIYQIHKDEDYSGYSSNRCEVANNILGMRDEELSVLSIFLQQKYQLRLGATIGRWKGDGCFTSWLGGEIEKLQSKVKNY